MTELLVVGAGPYALSAAALAREQGVETVILGRPMDFWRENMPAGMFLRSGPDWHLDANGVDTVEAFMEERGIAAEDVDPIPIAFYLDYTDWFVDRKGLEIRDAYVERLSRPNGGFTAELEDGGRIDAATVICAPGIRPYASVPDWAATVPAGRATHTCDLVEFEAFAGRRVLIVGGRQSAYEWAALLGDHGAERIDVVHRHEVPRFERVSWAFIDPHVRATVDVPGYWRNLSSTEREAIGRTFWEVGRLTLEAWLTPRLQGDRLHLWPGTEVLEVGVPDGDEGPLPIKLSNGERLAVDHVVFASGYRADLTKVGYLGGLMDDVELVGGFPRLDEAFQTTVPGLYLTGFSATQDFGPFFGFVGGCLASSRVIARDLAARG